MKTSRRAFLGHTVAGLGGLLLGACSHSSEKQPARRSAIILVHGAWHGAWCFTPLIAPLGDKGLSCVAVDLPGHGLSARFPQSYDQRPLNDAAFATEPSPVGHITLADYVTSLTGIIDDLVAGGFGPITLLGHSMGGLAITAAAEQNASKVDKLIYLAAFMPVAGKVGNAYATKDDEFPQLLRGDPRVIGVGRIDPRSTDPEYLKLMKTVFYGDVPDAEVAAIRHMLTPDDPTLPFEALTGATKEKWGRIPRSYIVCSQDRAMHPAKQRLFISEADTMSGNPTDVHELDASHSPFLSKPRELADLISRLAA